MPCSQWRQEEKLILETRQRTPFRQSCQTRASKAGQNNSSTVGPLSRSKGTEISTNQPERVSAVKVTWQSKISRLMEQCRKGYKSTSSQEIGARPVYNSLRFLTSSWYTRDWCINKTTRLNPHLWHLSKLWRTFVWDKTMPKTMLQ